MEDQIHSPVELDESGWRGRVVGVTRIGMRAGIVATLVLAVLFGLIVYGISTAGHRRALNSNNTGKLTKASEHQTPWWTGFPNAQPSPPVLTSAVPTPSRIPSLSTNAENATRLQQRVPEVAQVSALQMHELEAKQEREARRRALLDATARAPITVRLDVGGAEAGGLRQPTPSVLPTPGSPPGLTSNSAARQDAQSQDPRRAFLTPAAAGISRDRLFAGRQDDPSPYELHAGSIIPATLLTGINADLPGTILAQVRDDVFDSVTGRYLLIPRGTKLVGAYDNRIAQGQRRVLVAWTRLLYPDGSSLDLLGMAGTDPAGYAGFGAKVDEHLSKTFNAALLLSIISAGAQLSQPQRSATLNAVPDIGQTIAGAIGQQIGNTSIQLTQRQLQITPTLEVPPGYLFDVLVDRDIVLSGPYVGPGAR
jgi:type IV secretory pathway VirB10-like protein